MHLDLYKNEKFYFALYIYNLVIILISYGVYIVLKNILFLRVWLHYKTRNYTKMLLQLLLAVALISSLPCSIAVEDDQPEQISGEL